MGQRNPHSPSTREFQGAFCAHLAAKIQKAPAVQNCRGFLYSFNNVRVPGSGFAVPEQALGVVQLFFDLVGKLDQAVGRTLADHFAGFARQAVDRWVRAGADSPEAGLTLTPL
jgi:hypothetical protein